MSTIINTNSLSLLTQNNLLKSQSSLSTAIQRLSSGLRINSAKDDAAGQAIANRFTANIKGLTQATRNANDGISLAQTTEGALNEMNTNLQRVRELTVQSANGSNSLDDKKSIQAEIKQRLLEIDRTSLQTDFNGTKVLSSAAKDLNIQVGASDGQIIVIGLKEISTSTLSLGSFNVSGPQGATALAATANYQTAYGVTTAVSSNTVTDDKAALGTRLGISSATITFAGNAVIDTAGNWFAKVSITTGSAAEIAALKGQGIEVTSGVAKDFFVALDPQKAVVTGGTAAFSLAPATMSLSDFNTGASTNALQTLDNALKKVDELRSSLGAVQNRFDSVISNLGVTINNLSSSRSRIEDADYATEVSNMTRAQILQQAGTSVLAKANQSTQGVMTLLQ